MSFESFDTLPSARFPHVSTVTMNDEGGVNSLTEGQSLLPESTSSLSTSISINDLPFEVLANIFKKCLEKSTSVQLPYIQPDDESPPFIFLFVCKQWRNVALGSRKLWSQISVPLCKSYCLTETINPWHYSHVKFLSQFLSFSGQIPLHVQHLTSGRPVRSRLQHVAMHPNSKDVVACISQQAMDYSTRMLLALVDEERRWESLDIALEPELFQTFVNICDGYAAGTLSAAEGLGGNLQHLKIRLAPTFIGKRKPLLRLESLFQWIHQLPSLKSLCIEDSYCVIRDLTTFPLGRFDNVTFGRRNMSGSEAYKVLLRCGSQVTSLTLTSADSRMPPEEVTLPEDLLERPVALAKLRSLSLSGLPFEISLLSYFNMPHLVSLEITRRNLRALEGRENLLQQFLSDSHCSLERLSIHSWEMTAQCAISFLQIPALRGVPEVDIGSIPITAGYTDRDEVLIHIARALLWRDVKVECMVWAKLGDKQRPRYHIGWKNCFKENERFQYRFKDGEFML